MDIYKIAYLLPFLLIFSNNLFAGKKIEEIKINEAKGSAVVTESLVDAKNLALKNAKLNAFNQAGISETMQVFTDYFQGESEAEYMELFSSNAISQYSGAIKDLVIIEETKDLTSNGEFQINVLISCTVLKYKTSTDPTFEFEILGVNPHYDEGTGLEFFVKPTQNAYLNVFVFSSSDAYQLFPNNYENSKLLMQNKKQKFPVTGIKYTNTCGGTTETNRIVFVLTKEKIVYSGEVDYQSVIDWINTIPLDERCVKSHTYLVTE